MQITFAGSVLRQNKHSVMETGLDLQGFHLCIVILVSTATISMETFTM